MELIDTHIHLYDRAFDKDIDQVMERATARGVGRMILPAIDSRSWERQIKRAKRYPDRLFNAAGLHPTSVKENWEEELQFALEKIEQEEIVAVGEIGIDGYRSKEFIKEQIVVFEEQVKAAAKRDLPIIIHSRESIGLLFDSLEKLKHLNLRGVFHAYSGSFESYLEMRKYGQFYVGIGGVITFKNAKLGERVRRIKLESILLETDAPWLTPTPYRGKRNEPAYLSYVAEAVAKEHNCPVELVAKITTENATRLFNLEP